MKPKVPDCIVCMPVSLPGYVVPGSLMATCDSCFKGVWLAPSSLLVRSANPGARIMCIECAVAKLETEGGEFMDFNPDQLEEIQQFRNRN